MFIVILIIQGLNQNRYWMKRTIDILVIKQVFDNDADYNQIKESAEKAVKHYKGKLDLIYLFRIKHTTL